MVTAYYSCANELLFAYAKDSTGEYYEPTEKQLLYINEKLNEEQTEN